MIQSSALMQAAERIATGLEPEVAQALVKAEFTPTEDLVKVLLTQSRVSDVLTAVPEAGRKLVVKLVHDYLLKGGAPSPEATVAAAPVATPVASHATSNAAAHAQQPGDVANNHERRQVSGDVTVVDGVIYDDEHPEPTSNAAAVSRLQALAAGGPANQNPASRPPASQPATEQGAEQASDGELNSGQASESKASPKSYGNHKSGGIISPFAPGAPKVIS